MGYQYWKYETLHALCMEAFQKFGFTESDADIIQDVLLTSDLFGIESHGMILSAVHGEGDKEQLKLVIVGDDMPAGWKIS